MLVQVVLSVFTAALEGMRGLVIGLKATYKDYVI